VIEPSAAFQVTLVLLVVPCTAAVNCNDPPVAAAAVAGVTVTPVTVAALTVTVAVPDFDVSATLVAVTVSVPALDGAVYAPDDVIEPSAAFHVTPVFVVVPCTLAVNDALPPAVSDVAFGETVTPVTVPVATPVPVSGTITGFALALDIMDRFPLTLPLDVGAKLTANPWDCPPVRLTGAVSAGVLNPVPVTLTWLMLRLAEPVFVAVKVCEPVVPTEVVTAMLVGLTLSEAAGGAGLGDDVLPMTVQLQLQKLATTNAARNTRSEPRFSREEFIFAQTSTLSVLISYC